MLTTQNWIDAGYRRYDGQNLNNADFLLLKRFDDTEGKKYFLDVWAYDNRKFEFYRDNPELSAWSYQPEVQFQRRDDITLNITLSINESSTIQEIEQQVEKLWLFLGKPYYERFNEC